MPDTQLPLRWPLRFGLPDVGQTKAINAALAERPFIPRGDSRPLIRFLLDNVPNLVDKATDPETPLLPRRLRGAATTSGSVNLIPLVSGGLRGLSKKRCSRPNPEPAAVALAKTLGEFNR